MHAYPKPVASRTPSHFGVGAGARHLKSPTGGAAYGIPRNAALAPTARPRTRPARVRTMGALGSLRTIAADSPGVTADGAAPHAAAITHERAMVGLMGPPLPRRGRWDHSIAWGPSRLPRRYRASRHSRLGLLRLWLCGLRGRDSLLDPPLQELLHPEDQQQRRH